MAKIKQSLIKILNEHNAESTTIGLNFRKWSVWKFGSSKNVISKSCLPKFINLNENESEKDSDDSCLRKFSNWETLLVVCSFEHISKLQ